MLRRQAHARGISFAQFDEMTGYSPGHTAHLLAGRKQLRLRNLRKVLAMLGKDPGWFFRRYNPPGVPRPEIGFLPAHKKPTRHPPHLTFCDQLSEWCGSVSIDDTGGDDLPLLEPSSLQRLLGRDLVAAHQLGSSWLQASLAFRPISLSTGGAERLVRVMTILGHTLRIKGDRNSAADLLDCAFVVEANLDDLSLRALTFRTGAYLLSDLGHLDDAGWFAEQATALCRQLQDQLGIGRSLYIEGLVLRRQGNDVEALGRFRESLKQLSDTLTTSPFSVAVRFVLIRTQLEQGRVDGLEDELAALEKSVPPESAGYTNLLILSAELASQCGDHTKADQLFDQAENHLATCLEEKRACLDDLAILRLRQILHLTRTARHEIAVQKCRQLYALADQFSEYPHAEAALLEVARHALGGGLTLSLVSAYVRTVEDREFLKPGSIAIRK